MKRKIVGYATLFSFLLLVASVWWWVGSSSKVTQVSLRTRGQSAWQVWGHAGKLAFTKSATPASSGGELSWSVTPHTATDGAGVSALTAFSYAGGSGQSALTLPVWAVVFSSALLPGAWLKGKFAKKKKPSH